jgi:RNA binding exosome subunit
MARWHLRSMAIMLGMIVLLAPTLAGTTGLFEEVQKMLFPPGQGSLDDTTVVSGLKEALSVASGNAVALTGKLDGYYGNQVIRILMPEKIRKVADIASKLGFQKEVDDFVLSMNRAAEHAAPKAKEYFINAVKQMTFEDAKNILRGGDTAATEYFKAKTYDKLFAAFEPEVSSSMNEVGVTRAYKAMIDRYQSIPFMKAESLDLDRYVTGKSLDGLFYMVGQEEKKIRTDPAARVTDLLRQVFGQGGR